MKYTKKEYLNYCKKIKKAYPDGKTQPVDFKHWLYLQPISDKVADKINHDLFEDCRVY
jgi:hypothetical protein